MSSQENSLPRADDISKQAWENLSNKKIYFGHQSVGFNIIDGVEDILKEYPFIRLKIRENDKPGSEGGGLIHSRVGQNVNPKSKIDDFSFKMQGIKSGKFDIAGFKLCYVDIHTQTDIESIFSQYKKTMAELAEKYPETIFIHFTVPLTSEPKGLKAFITSAKGLVKRVLGKVEMFDNTVKKKYNELIRKEYGSGGHLFDLAAAESTGPDGRRMFYEKNGQQIYSLIPGYTEDGGHLNAEGRKFVAEQFLIFLANLK